MRFMPFVLMLLGSLATSLSVAAGAVAQGLPAAASPLQSWRHHSQGMSTNAALAFYRVYDPSRPTALQQPPIVRRHPPRATAQSPTTYADSRYYRRAYYSIPLVGYHAPPVVSAPAEPGFQAKPFAHASPPPNAIDRYWPLLMQRRKDPETGLIIWELP